MISSKNECPHGEQFGYFSTFLKDHFILQNYTLLSLRKKVQLEYFVRSQLELNCYTYDFDAEKRPRELKKVNVKKY